MTKKQIHEELRRAILYFVADMDGGENFEKAMRTLYRLQTSLKKDIAQQEAKNE